MTHFEIQPRGPFSLAASVRFFGRWEGTSGADATTDASTLRVAFLADDWSGPAGLILCQAAGDLTAPLAGEIVAGSFADAARVQRQITRILSLDHDATAYVEVGRRDPVVAARQHASDFLRPALFNSPYEAACWAIISSRLRDRRARGIRSAMGATLTVEGVALDVFPSPQELLARDTVPGLNAEKVTRLHGIARAALEGRLDADRLRALEPDDALADVQELRGIGPFSAALTVVRGAGLTDVLVLDLPPMRAAAARAYERPDLESDDAAFAALAETWRPFRTWVTALLRATA